MGLWPLGHIFGLQTGCNDPPWPLQPLLATLFWTEPTLWAQFSTILFFGWVSGHWTPLMAAMFTKAKSTVFAQTLDIFCLVWFQHDSFFCYIFRNLVVRHPCPSCCFFRFPKFSFHSLFPLLWPLFQWILIKFHSQIMRNEASDEFLIETAQKSLYRTHEMFVKLLQNSPESKTQN